MNYKDHVQFFLSSEGRDCWPSLQIVGPPDSRCQPSGVTGVRWTNMFLWTSSSCYSRWQYL